MRCIRPTLMAHSRATLVEANRFGAVSGAKKRKEREQLGRDFRFVWLSILVSSSGDGMFVTAFPLLAAILTRDPVLIAGITREPTAFQGDSLLLPSVAVVVLGGTSLLGGRGYPISTVVAAFYPLAYAAQVAEARLFVFAVGAQEDRAQFAHQRLELLAGEALVGDHGVAIEVHALEHLGKKIVGTGIHNVAAANVICWLSQSIGVHSTCARDHRSVPPFRDFRQCADRMVDEA